MEALTAFRFVGDVHVDHAEPPAEAADELAAAPQVLSGCDEQPYESDATRLEGTG